MFPTICLLHPVTSEYVAEKRARKQCITWRCRRTPMKQRKRCSTCACRLYRLRHPEYYVFAGLKASARSRRIGFELSFQEFCQFIEGSDYMEKRGIEPTSLTIDRIKNELPYRLGNMRFMSHADNSSHRYETANEPAEF